MATWVDFKELRQKLRFADVLQSYNVQLKTKGDRATGFCPLPGHDGKRRSPSFSVNLGRNIFQCFGCGAKGNVLDFACRMEGLDPASSGDFRKVAIKLQEKFGLTSSGTKAPVAAPVAAEPSAATVPAPPPAPAEASAAKPPAADAASVVNAPIEFELKHLDPGHPYLASRGFTPETIAQFGLGFCAKGLMKDRIAIPLHNPQGQLVGYAGRLVDDAKVSEETPKYLFPGTRQRNGTPHEFRKSELIYNFHRIEKPVRDLIVVEGFASVWWLWQHGFRNSVALMGSSISLKQGELLHDLLHPDGRLWIFTDGDKAGERCAQDVFFDLAPHRWVRWVKLADGQPTGLSGEELAAVLPSK